MVDIELQDRVHSLLRESPHVPHWKLRLEAWQGQVTLKGEVRTYYEKQMAQEALRGIEGINKIENQLEVTWN